MTSLNGSSRDADKFVVRLPDGMRDQVAAAADADDRSMNSLIITAIRNELDGRERANALLNALAQAVDAKGVTHAGA
jgi:predicted transcriptional regulator